MPRPSSSSRRNCHGGSRSQDLSDEQSCQAGESRRRAPRSGDRDPAAHCAPRLVQAAPCIALHELSPNIVAHATNTEKRVICSPSGRPAPPKLDHGALDVHVLRKAALELHCAIDELENRVRYIRGCDQKLAPKSHCLRQGRLRPMTQHTIYHIHTQWEQSGLGLLEGTRMNAWIGPPVGDRTACCTAGCTLSATIKRLKHNRLCRVPNDSKHGRTAHRRELQERPWGSYRRVEQQRRESQSTHSRMHRMRWAKMLGKSRGPPPPAPPADE